MGKPKEARKVLRYSSEFKAKAVQLSRLSGVLTQDVAGALGIHPFMLSRWKKEFREGRLVVKKAERLKIPEKTTSELKRLREIERKYSMLKEEHALLKKAIQFCSERRQKSSSSWRLRRASTVSG